MVKSIRMDKNLPDKWKHPENRGYDSGIRKGMINAKKKKKGIK